MWLRPVLAVVYLGMAAGQVGSWSAMPAILAACRLLPERGSRRAPRQPSPIEEAR